MSQKSKVKSRLTRQCSSDFRPLTFALRLTMKYLILILVFILWLGGCSREVMQTLYKTGVIADDYRYGDLYRLSNLPQFKDPVRPCSSPPASTASGKKTALYVIGDSFTEPERLSQRDFPGGDFLRTKWENHNQVQLDTTKRNILLIETVERHFREHFAQPVSNLTIVADTTNSGPPTANLTGGPQQSLTRRISDFIQSKGIEERLETVLFSHAVFLWFKERKASLNLNWFGRVAPTVGISQDRNHLFAGLDTDTTKHKNSSFAPLPDAELNALIDSVNVTADRYRAAGFDAVYLSIIPNKASILDPAQGPYNHLVERVESHPRLRVPVVSVYADYKRQPAQVYAIGDSHWNCTGRGIWIGEVRKAVGL